MTRTRSPPSRRTSTGCTRGWTRCGPARRPSWPPCAGRPGRAPTRTGPSATPSPALHEQRLAQLRGRRRTGCASAGSTCATAPAATSAGSGSPTTSRPSCWSTGGRRRPAPFYQATAAAPGRGRPPAPPRHPRPHGDRRRGRGARPRLDGRRPSAATLTGEGALLAAVGAPPHRPDGRHRRHHPGRAGPGDPQRPGRRRWSCRAAPAPARPRSRCTARPTCSTPTASGWPAAACCWSGPNPLFLRYIEQVLPSLGETGVRAVDRRPTLPRRQRGARAARRGGRAQG